MSSIRPIIKQLFAGFVHAEGKDETILVYVRLLQDIAPDELQVVVDQALVEHKFLPTVSELRAMWQSLTTPVEQEGAIEAWGKVQRAILSVGSWGTPTFASPITQAVVQGMGWRELCQSENQMADRAHFLKAYEQVKARQAAQGRLLPQARALIERKGLTHMGQLVPQLISQQEESLL